MQKNDQHNKVANLFQYVHIDTSFPKLAMIATDEKTSQSITTCKQQSLKQKLEAKKILEEIMCIGLVAKARKCWLV